MISAPERRRHRVEGDVHPLDHERRPAGREHDRDQRDERPGERPVDRDQHRRRPRAAPPTVSSSGCPRASSWRRPRARQPDDLSPRRPAGGSSSVPGGSICARMSSIRSLLLVERHHRDLKADVGGARHLARAGEPARRVGRDHRLRKYGGSAVEHARGPPPASARRCRTDRGARAPGQRSACSQLGNSPPKPWRLEHALLERAHPLDQRRIGEVGRLDATLTSPETPVACSSSSTSWSAGQAAGNELADVGDDLGLGPGDPAGARQHERDGEHAPGAAIPAAIALRPAAASASRRDVAPLARAGGRARARREETRGRGLAALRIPAQREDREARRERDHERERDPEHERAARRSAPSGSATAAGPGSRPPWRARRGDHGPAARRRLARRPRRAGRDAWRSPRGSGPGTGSRSRPRGRSGSGSTASDGHRQRAAEDRQPSERDRRRHERDASGSSRSGGPKTSVSVSAMTTSATPSSTTISLSSSDGSPSTTTGMPLTT